MALNVKLPFGKSGGKLYQCNSCNFSTKYGPLYSTHITRCSKVKCGPNVGQSIPRNYSCDLCEYKTNQSRLFLVHQIQAHKATFPIYPCEYCGYATRYRNKMMRHHSNIHPEYGDLSETDVNALPLPVEMEKVQADLIAKGFMVEPENIKVRTDGTMSKVFRSPTASPKTSPASGGSKISSAEYIYEQTNEETGSIEFQCKLCTYKSPQRFSAMKHVRNMHINGKLYCCDQCNFSTEKKIEFSIHKAKHANQRMFNCSECEYETNQKSNLDRHQANHTGKGPIKCELCSYSSTGGPAILRHMQEHHRGASISQDLTNVLQQAKETEYEDIDMEDLDDTGAELMNYEDYKKLNELEEDGIETDNIGDGVQYESGDGVINIEPMNLGEDDDKEDTLDCPVCNIKLSRTQMRGHVVVHPVLQPWICPDCGLRYRRSPDLGRHLKLKHKKHISEYDRQTLVTLNSVENQEYNSSDSNANSTTTGEQPLDLSYRQDLELDESQGNHVFPEFHKCRYCSYRAKFPADLRRHMSQSHRNQLQAVGRFACTHCEKSYKYRSDLYVHMRKSHRIDTSRLKPIHAIPVSPSKTAGSSENVSPSDTKPRMKYTPIKSINVPKKNETPDKMKHRCLYCDYVGNCKSEIERHTLTHTGQKPFQCLFCDYKTIWKGDMKRHLPKHHKDEVDKDDLMNLLEKTYKPAEVPDKSLETSYESFLEAESSEYNENEEKIESDAPTLEYEATKEVNEPYTMEQLYGPSVFEAGIYEAGTVVVIPEAPEDSNSSIVQNGSFEAQMKSYPELGDNPEYIDMEHDDFKKTLTPMKDSFDDDSFSGSGRPSRSSSSTPVDNKITKSDEFTMKTDSDGKTIVYCPKCTFTCDAPSKMKSHVAIHDNVKKYKCSYCGKRSNWLWDVRKHIKANHPNKDPKNVITMSVEEARATLDEYLNSAHKTVMRKRSLKSVYVNDSPSQVLPGSMFYSMGGNSPDVSMQDLSAIGDSRESSPQIEDPNGYPMNYKKIPPEQRVKPFKCSTCGKRSNWKHDLVKHIKQHHKGRGDVLTMTLREARETLDEVESTPEKTSPKAPVTKTRTSVSPRNQISGVAMRGLGLKRFKCPECPYRSDYSGDIQRHIPRRHPENPTASMITLSYEEASSTIGQYDYSWAKNRAKPNKVQNKIQNTGDSSMNTVGTKGKKFKCSRCEFRAGDKGSVIKHLRAEHGGPNKAEVYKCKLCHYHSVHVESVRFHLREKHKSVDYNALIVKSNADGPDSDQRMIRSPLFKIKVDPRTGRFKCADCGFLSPWKHSAERHIKTKHPELSIDETLMILEPGPTPSPTKSAVRQLYPKIDDSKRIDGFFNCHICPYKSKKKHLYRLHLTRHKKTPGNPLGCKYCSFFTCNSRLLNQHVQLHLNDPRGVWACKDNAVVLPPSLQKKKYGRHRSYYCDKCPYIGKNLSDFLYHKQFHRPKANAPFKCESCPYWASVKRLITQHKKVHSPHYQESLKSIGRYPAGQNITLINGSPAKTDVSEDSYCVYDPIQMANLKQSIILSKVKGVPIPNSSLKPHQFPMTPGTAMKHNTDPDLMYGAVISKSGIILNSSMYKKFHKCSFCPYTNVKETNVKNHEKMHGPIEEGEETHKCQYCDYHSKEKALLKYHIKVHSKQYNPYMDEIKDTEKGDSGSDSDNNEDCTISTPQKTPVKLDASRIPSDTGFYIKFDEKTGEHRLESIRMKKWCCERCPYATAKQAQFERHVKLHNSKQKYTCEYCDYSVPGYNLLLQHKRIHLYPNHNLIVTQSVSNLMKLPEVDADVAAAATFSCMSEKTEENTNSVHDHLELYENTESFTEPKKLYRCDRCPYANVQRSHLLSHLKCHVIKNSLQCPHCDYSVSKQHLLMQHVKIHFTGMDSDHTTGKSDDSESTEEELAVPLQNDEVDEKTDSVELLKIETVGEEIKNNNNKRKLGENEAMDIIEEDFQTVGKKVKVIDDVDTSKEQCKEKEVDVTEEMEDKNIAAKELNNNNVAESADTLWICQYCDRAFSASEKLLQHEMQHLVGNKI